MTRPTLAQPVTLPSSHAPTLDAQGAFLLTDDTAPDADTAEKIRAHLRATFNRDGLLSAKEAA